MSTKDKWVRRFTVDETAKHKNGFTIYKITSVLFPLESPEAVTVVSVWKRYSDVQALHRSIKALHSGLHLRGTFPILPKNNYFKRFQSEVIEERAKSIKTLLEFVAEYRLLFTSTVFVNFLQSGYAEPVPRGGVINAIRSSLHLPIEDTPPLEYQTSDDDSRSPNSAKTPQENVESNVDISQIPIYEAADVELRQSPKNTRTDSFESINSIESINSDFYDELNKITIDKTKPSVKTKNVLPDLINFDAPSTSKALKFDDYHTMRTETDAITSDSPIRVKEMENSYVFESPLYDTNTDDVSVTSRAMDTEVDGVPFLSKEMCVKETEICKGVSLSSEVRSNDSDIYEGVSSLSSEVRVKETDICDDVSSLSSEMRVKETEDSYVFEAGYLLSLGARSEDSGHYRRAFHCYRAGIEKMLIGVRSDSDAQRRAIIKEKINKYLSYAETIYNNHLVNTEDNEVGEVGAGAGARLCPPPLSMVSGATSELAQYRVLAVLGPAVMLVLHRRLQTCYAMKVIRKIPHNLTEFDEYFLQRTNETRQPILPTLIPYMVPLHAYIQTNNLIFLILSYAPGKKLFDYIKEYKSIPNTPNRQVNLENVFTEPTKKQEVNDNEVNSIQDVNENNSNDLSINELVRNSQKLLQNVDKVLTEVKENVEHETEIQGNETKGNEAIEKPLNRCVPASAICCWAAQLLVAIEALHNCGVVCGDLHPRNILLGEKGQIILTYFIHYPGVEMSVCKARDVSMYVAPELYSDVFVDTDRGGDSEGREGVCDYWSYGAILYELICGLPLSHYHRTVFTSHTLLQLPDGLPLHAHSLLTQLLISDPTQRLGGGRAGVQEIKQHPYFRDINWTSVRDDWAMPS